MSESLVSHAARLLRAGNEFSETNQKLRESVHAFLNWFVPKVRWEQMPIRDMHVNDNQVCSLSFRTTDDRLYLRVCADGADSTIRDYQEFCRWYNAHEEELVSWLERLTAERAAAADKFIRAIVR